MAVKFSNNASTQLSAAITTSATSVVVADSSELPTLSAGDHTYVTLANAGGTKIEVVKVTAIASNTLTVIRGQDNTSALAFSAGDLCELRLTAALLTDTSTLQTGAEIKTAYEAEVNAFTDTQFTKLAGIEAAADITDTTNVVGALTAGTNVAITAGGTISSTDTTYSVGDGGLTQVNFTTADNTKLDGIEALADVTDVTNVTAAGALMDSELVGLAAVKATTGTFLTADQTKLDGIATSANNYSHPTSEHLPSTVSQTEAGYLNGVTGAIQTQLDAKQASDATIVVDADIGTTVQAYDATIVVDADIGSTVQAYDADTTKNDVANTFSADQTFKAITETKTTKSSSFTPNLSTEGTLYSCTGTMTITMPSAEAGKSFTIIHATATSITWAGTIKWNGGSAPTAGSGIDIYVFTSDGSNWYGMQAGTGFA